MKRDFIHSTAEVVKMTGVTSRALRHYHKIGLLEPILVKSGGIRYYGKDEMLKLQQILLFRQQDVPLIEIKRILTGEKDQLTVLEEHYTWLLAESKRMQQLAETVARTKEMLIKGKKMETKEIFDGFDHSRYRGEAIDRWGKDKVESSEKKFNAMSKQERQAFMQEHEDIVERLARAKRAGIEPESAEVQDIVKDHYAWIKHSWTPDAESYKGLGQMYVDDKRFTKTYDKHEEGTVKLLNEGIKVFVKTL
ncbi:MAG: MerR family transcriptional regulator [Micrococcaceae bacterium]